MGRNIFICGRCGMEIEGFNPSLLICSLCPTCAEDTVKEANAALPALTEEEQADYALYMVEHLR